MESFANARPVSASGLFAGMKSLARIEGMEYLNTSEATSMSAMFQDCQQLVNIDGLEYLNTSKVTNMNSMFRNCHQLESIDMSHFDTSEVTNMDNMFYNCHALKALDLSHFDTSRLDNFYWMFVGCDNLECLNLTNFQLNTPYDMQTGNIISNLTNLKELYISESLNKKLMKDECRNIGSIENPCILHAPEGIFEDRQDTNWFYWKGGIFKGPDTDKIDTVASDTNPFQDACYNLQGMRVMPGQKGVYIRNGKKYVVR
jgi:surface protein